MKLSITLLASLAACALAQPAAAADGAASKPSTTVGQLPKVELKDTTAAAPEAKQSPAGAKNAGRSVVELPAKVPPCPNPKTGCKATTIPQQAQ